MKVLIGTLGRGHVERYRAEFQAAAGLTCLRDIELAFDTGDVAGRWGHELEACDALIILSDRGLDADAIDRARRLTIVQKIGAAHGIDIDACRKRNIVVASVPDMNHMAVADHTIMFMLCMARHTLPGHADVLRGDCPADVTPIVTTQSRRNSNWLDHERDSYGLLADQTLGLIGFGDIARHVARRAKGFEMNILYTKRTRLPPDIESEYGVVYHDMGSLLQESDYVSLHATLPEDGRPIIGARELEMMKSTSILINTARGNQIDQAALIACLKRGGIGGACLDVFDVEPVPVNEFQGLSIVLLSPHTAGVTPWRLRFRDVAMNIEAFLNKRPLKGEL